MEALIIIAKHTKMPEVSNANINGCRTMDVEVLVIPGLDSAGRSGSPAPLSWCHL